MTSDILSVLGCKIKGRDMDSFENENLTPLIALYREIFAEIRRYRDMEWKIVLWTVVLMGGIATAVRLTSIQQDHKPYIKTLLCIFTVGVAIYGGWHIHHIHKRLTWYRNLRRKCDRIFRFFDDKTYSDEAILPKKWKFKDEDISYSEGLKHLISWWILIALTTIYALYTIVFM